MIENLNEIKRIRKSLGINQKELAKRAGVSQSLIAKIKAGEIMNKKVVFAHVKDKVKEVIQTMKKKGISQMPVLLKEKVCGLMTEGAILRTIIDHPEKINQLTVEEIMEDTP